MSEHYDIRQLFAELRLEQFLAYLPANGWQRTVQQGDRVRFELSDGADPYVLLLPRSSRSPGSRGLLQKAVYMLSGIEDRQPFEIALAIIKMQPDVAISEKKPTDGVRLRFVNAQDVSIKVRISSRPGSTLLMPGEAIEVLGSATTAAPLEIEIAGDCE